MSADRDIKPGPVPVETLRYWAQKGLKPSFHWSDVWRQEHDAAFTAAKVLRLDVLEALRDELDTAIAEGVPYEQFVREVQPRLSKLGWWEPHEVVDPETGKAAKVDPPRRLALIYETNMRTSRAVGQWERIERNAKLRPYLLYQVGPSKRHREQHLAWHGLLLPVDDEFWSFAFPSNGFGCKCHTRSVSKSEYRDLSKRGVIEGVPEPILDDEGLPTGHVREKRVPVQTTAPKVPLVPWTNKRTGETQLVREGIDPGFDKRPGEGRRDVVREQKARVAEAQGKKPPEKRKR
jgi:hypothetical protein